MNYRHTDPRVLFGAIGDDLDGFRALSQTFLDIAPPLCQRLQAAIRAGDSAAALHHAHSLRGSTALVGAAQLSRLLHEVEALARRGAPALALLPELARLFDAVLHEVGHGILHFQGGACRGPD